MSKGTINGVDFVNPTPTLEKNGVMFGYGKDKQEQWIKSKAKFLAVIGAAYGQNVVDTVKNDKITIAEMKEPEYTDDEFNTATAREKRIWARQEVQYDGLSSAVMKDVSKAKSMLWSSCTLALQDRLKVHPDYTTGLSAGELWNLIGKICNGSSATTADNTISNFVEALYSFASIKGDDYATQTLYLESFENRRKVAEEAGLVFSTTKLRNMHLSELDRRGASDTIVYKKLNDWKLADATSSGDADVKAGAACLSEVVATNIFIKRSGLKFTDFRREQENGYNNGAVIAATTLHEGSRRMALWKPSIVVTNYNGTAEVHLQSDGGQWTLICFKCGREGHTKQECTFNLKKDGTPVNDQNAINRQFDEMKAKASKTEEEKAKEIDDEHTSNKEGEDI